MSAPLANADSTPSLKRIARDASILTAVALAIRYVFGEAIVEVVIGTPPQSLAAVLFTGAGFLCLTLAGSIIMSLFRDTDDLKFASFADTLLNHGRRGQLTFLGLVALVGPVFEEVLFRVIPFALMTVVAGVLGSTGLADPINAAIAITATGIWVYQHGDRAPVIAISGVFYVVLLFNGLLLEAFVYHVFANAVLATLAIATVTVQRRFTASEYDAEPAPPDAPALPKPSLMSVIKAELLND